MTRQGPRERSSGRSSMVSPRGSVWNGASACDPRWGGVTSRETFTGPPSSMDKGRRPPSGAAPGPRRCGWGRSARGGPEMGGGDEPRDVHRAPLVHGPGEAALVRGVARPDGEAGTDGRGEIVEHESPPGRIIA